MMFYSIVQTLVALVATVLIMIQKDTDGILLIEGHKGLFMALILCSFLTFHSIFAALSETSSDSL